MFPAFGTIRTTGIIVAALLVYFELIRSSNYDTSEPSTVSSARRFGSVLFKSSHSTAFSNHYDHPHDLVLPLGPGRSDGVESFIGKVTAIFHGSDPTLLRAMRTHKVHNRRFGYSLHALRHRILDDTWSKPAYLLAVLLEEMRKPEGHRLKWLMCGPPANRLVRC